MAGSCWSFRARRNCRSIRLAAGEILEFQQLEKEGWLADLLQPATPLSPGLARTPGNLASAAAESPGPGEVQSWADQLSRLFDRMSDSLDEY
jgi:hypothetical protein